MYIAMIKVINGIQWYKLRLFYTSWSNKYLYNLYSQNYYESKKNNNNKIKNELKTPTIINIRLYDYIII